MYLNIYFTSKENPRLHQEFSSTNDLYIEYDNYYSEPILKENCFKFSYKLRDNIATHKFIEQLEKIDIIASSYSEYPKMIGYNIYETQSAEKIIEKRIELNNLIDYVNTKNYLNISESLKLDINSNDTQNDKLNKLHYIFESEKQLSIQSNSINNDYNKCLEKLNQLVHACESGLSNDKSCYQVFRIHTSDLNVETHEKMTDELYNLMDVATFGTLQIDYGMVGKDLFACYSSNDIDLVKQLGLVQQERLTTWISAVFDGDDETNYENIKQQYYTWCENNNVNEYYNYLEPRFNHGRLIIGDWVEKDIHDIDSVLDIKSKFPYLLDIKLEDE
jgi:hypothetical protein